MNAVSLGLAAVLLFSAQNVIIERKLAGVSPVANIIAMTFGALVLACLYMVFKKNFGFQVTMPTGSQVLFALACGAILFVADICFLGAYHKQGSLITVTTILALMPVFASVGKWLTGGGFPSAANIIGYACAFAAVILVSK